LTGSRNTRFHMLTLNSNLERKLKKENGFIEGNYLIPHQKRKAVHLIESSG